MTWARAHNNRSIRIDWLKLADASGALPTVPPAGGMSLAINMMFDGLVELDFNGAPYITDKGKKLLADNPQLEEPRK